MKNKKPIIIISIIVALVLIVIICFTVFATDIFKSPEQLFRKYLMNNAKLLSEYNMKPYDEVLKRMKNELLEFICDIEYNDKDSDSDIKVTTDSKYDLPNNNIELEVKAEKNDKKILNVSVLGTDEKIGVKVEELHDKYIGLENKNLKQFVENLGANDDIIEMVPDEIPSAKPFSDKEIKILKNVMMKYLDASFDKINKKSYVKEKNINTDINENTIKTTKYTLTITEQQLLSLVNEYMENLLNDQDFLNLLKDRVDNSTIEELKQKVNDAKEEIDETLDEEIKISVYASKKKVVKTEIVLEESDSIAFSIINNDNTSTLSFLIQDGSYSVGRKETLNLINKFENNIGELSIETKTEYNKDDIEKLKSNLDEENDDDYISSYDSDYYDNLYEDENSKFVLKTTKDGENIKGSLETDSEDFENTDISFTFKFNNNIKINKITDDNIILINDYKEDDYQNLFMEILENASNAKEKYPDSLIINLLSIFTNINDNDDEIEYDSRNDLDLYNTTSPILDNNEDDEEVNNEFTKALIQEQVEDGLEYCFDTYRDELSQNKNANIDDYLTVENVQLSCQKGKLELVEGTTMKCIVDDKDVYYVIMDIDINDLKVNKVDVYTEEEYENL